MERSAAASSTRDLGVAFSAMRGFHANGDGEHSDSHDGERCRALLLRLLRDVAAFAREQQLRLRSEQRDVQHTPNALLWIHAVARVCEERIDRLQRTGTLRDAGETTAMTATPTDIVAEAMVQELLVSLLKIRLAETEAMVLDEVENVESLRLLRVGLQRDEAALRRAVRDGAGEDTQLLELQRLLRDAFVDQLAQSRAQRVADALHNESSLQFAWETIQEQKQEIQRLRAENEQLKSLETPLSSVPRHTDSARQSIQQLQLQLSSHPYTRLPLMEAQLSLLEAAMGQQDSVDRSRHTVTTSGATFSLSRDDLDLDRSLRDSVLLPSHLNLSAVQDQPRECPQCRRYGRAYVECHSDNKRLRAQAAADEDAIVRAEQAYINIKNEHAALTSALLVAKQKQEELRQMIVDVTDEKLKIQSLHETQQRTNEQQVASIQRQLTELEQSKERSARERVDALICQEALENELTRLQASVGALERERDTLLEGTQQLKLEVAELKSQAAVAKTDADVAAGNLATTERELQSVQQSLEAALQQVSKHESTIETLKCTQQELTESKASASSRVKQLQTERDLLADNTQRLRQEILDAKAEADQKLVVLTSKANHDAREVKQLKASHAALQAECDLLLENIQRLKQEVADRKAETVLEKDGADDARRALRTAKSELTSAKETLEAAHQVITDHESTIQRLEGALRQHLEAEATALQQVRQLQSERDTLIESAQRQKSDVLKEDVISNMFNTEETREPMTRGERELDRSKEVPEAARRHVLQHLPATDQASSSIGESVGSQVSVDTSAIGVQTVLSPVDMREIGVQTAPATTHTVHTASPSIVSIQPGGYQPNGRTDRIPSSQALIDGEDSRVLRQHEAGDGTFKASDDNAGGRKRVAQREVASCSVIVSDPGTEAGNASQPTGRIKHECVGVVDDAISEDWKRGAANLEQGIGFCGENGAERDASDTEMTEDRRRCVEQLEHARKPVRVYEGAVGSVHDTQARHSDDAPPIKSGVRCTSDETRAAALPEACSSSPSATTATIQTERIPAIWGEIVERLLLRSSRRRLFCVFVAHQKVKTRQTRIRNRFALLVTKLLSANKVHALQAMLTVTNSELRWSKHDQEAAKQKQDDLRKLIVEITNEKVKVQSLHNSQQRTTDQQVYDLLRQLTEKEQELEARAQEQEDALACRESLETELSKLQVAHNEVRKERDLLVDAMNRLRQEVADVKLESHKTNTKETHEDEVNAECELATVKQSLEAARFEIAQHISTIEDLERERNQLLESEAAASKQVRRIQEQLEDQDAGPSGDTKGAETRVRMSTSGVQTIHSSVMTCDVSVQTVQARESTDSVSKPVPAPTVMALQFAVAKGGERAIGSLPSRTVDNRADFVATREQLVEGDCTDFGQPLTQQTSSEPAKLPITTVPGSINESCGGEDDRAQDLVSNDTVERILAPLSNGDRYGRRPPDTVHVGEVADEHRVMKPSMNRAVRSPEEFVKQDTSQDQIERDWLEDHAQEPRKEALDAESYGGDVDNYFTASTSGKSELVSMETHGKATTKPVHESENIEATPVSVHDLEVMTKRLEVAQHEIEQHQSTIARLKAALNERIEVTALRRVEEGGVHFEGTLRRAEEQTVQDELAPSVSNSSEGALSSIKRKDYEQDEVKQSPESLDRATTLANSVEQVKRDMATLSEELTTTKIRANEKSNALAIAESELESVKLKLEEACGELKQRGSIIERLNRSLAELSQSELAASREIQHLKELLKCHRAGVVSEDAGVQTFNSTSTAGVQTTPDPHNVVLETSQTHPSRNFPARIGGSIKGATGETTVDEKRLCDRGATSKSREAVERWENEYERSSTTRSKSQSVHRSRKSVDEVQVRVGQDVEAFVLGEEKLFDVSVQTEDDVMTNDTSEGLHECTLPSSCHADQSMAINQEVLSAPKVCGTDVRRIAIASSGNAQLSQEAPSAVPSDRPSAMSLEAARREIAMHQSTIARLTAALKERAHAHSSVSREIGQRQGESDEQQGNTQELLEEAEGMAGRTNMKNVSRALNVAKSKRCDEEANLTLESTKAGHTARTSIMPCKLVPFETTLDSAYHETGGRQSVIQRPPRVVEDGSAIEPAAHQNRVQPQKFYHEVVEVVQRPHHDIDDPKSGTNAKKIDGDETREAFVIVERELVSVKQDLTAANEQIALCEATIESLTSELREVADSAVVLEAEVQRRQVEREVLLKEMDGLKQELTKINAKEGLNTSRMAKRARDDECAARSGALLLSNSHDASTRATNDASTEEAWQSLTGAMTNPTSMEKSLEAARRQISQQQSTIESLKRALKERCDADVTVGIKQTAHDFEITTHTPTNAGLSDHNHGGAKKSDDTETSSAQTRISSSGLRYREFGPSTQVREANNHGWSHTGLCETDSVNARSEPARHEAASQHSTTETSVHDVKKRYETAAEPHERVLRPTNEREGFKKSVQRDDQETNTATSEEDGTKPDADTNRMALDIAEDKILTLERDLEAAREEIASREAAIATLKSQRLEAAESEATASTYVDERHLLVEQLADARSQVVRTYKALTIAEDQLRTSNQSLDVARQQISQHESTLVRLRSAMKELSESEEAASAHVVEMESERDLMVESVRELKRKIGHLKEELEIARTTARESSEGAVRSESALMKQEIRGGEAIGESLVRGAQEVSGTFVSAAAPTNALQPHDQITRQASYMLEKEPVVQTPTFSSPMSEGATHHVVYPREVIAQPAQQRSVSEGAEMSETPALVLGPIGPSHRGTSDVDGRLRLPHSTHMDDCGVVGWEPSREETDELQQRRRQESSSFIMSMPSMETELRDIHDTPARGDNFGIVKAPNDRASVAAASEHIGDCTCGAASPTETVTRNSSGMRRTAERAEPPQEQSARERVDASISHESLRNELERMQAIVGALVKERNVLLEGKEQLELDVAELKSQLTVAKTNGVTTAGVLATTEHELQLAQQRLEAKQQQVSKHEVTIESLNRVSIDLTESEALSSIRAQQLESERDLLLDSIQQLRQVIVEATEDTDETVNALTRPMNHDTCEVQQASTRATTLHAECDGVTDGIQRLKQEVAGLREKMRLEKTNAGEFRHALQTAEKELVAMKQALETSQQVIAQHEATIRRLERDLQECSEAATVSNEQVRQLMNERDAQIESTPRCEIAMFKDNMMREGNKTRESLTSGEYERGRIMQSPVHQHRLRNQLTIDRESSTTENWVGIQTGIDEHVISLQTLGSAVDTREIGVQTLPMTADSHTATQASSPPVMEDDMNRRKEVCQLQGQLKRQSAKISEECRAIASIQVTHIQNERDLLVEQVSDLHDQLADARTQVDEANKSLTTAEDDLRTTNESLNAARQQIAQHESTFVKLKGALKELSESEAGASAHVVKLESERDSLVERVQELEHQLGYLEEELEVAQVIARESSESGAEARLELAEMKQSLVVARQEIRRRERIGDRLKRTPHEDSDRWKTAAVKNDALEAQDQGKHQRLRTMDNETTMQAPRSSGSIILKAAHHDDAPCESQSARRHSQPRQGWTRKTSLRDSNRPILRGSDVVDEHHRTARGAQRVNIGSVCRRGTREEVGNHQQRRCAGSSTYAMPERQFEREQFDYDQISGHLDNPGDISAHDRSTSVMNSDREVAQHNDAGRSAVTRISPGVRRTAERSGPLHLAPRLFEQEPSDCEKKGEERRGFSDPNTFPAMCERRAHGHDGTSDEKRSEKRVTDVTLGDEGTTVDDHNVNMVNHQRLTDGRDELQQSTLSQQERNQIQRAHLRAWAALSSTKLPQNPKPHRRIRTEIKSSEQLHSVVHECVTLLRRCIRDQRTHATDRSHTQKVVSTTNKASSEDWTQVVDLNRLVWVLLEASRQTEELKAAMDKKLEEIHTREGQLVRLERHCAELRQIVEAYQAQRVHPRQNQQKTTEETGHRDANKWWLSPDHPVCGAGQSKVADPRLCALEKERRQLNQRNVAMLERVIEQLKDAKAARQKLHERLQLKTRSLDNAQRYCRAVCIENLLLRAFFTWRQRTLR